MLGGTGQPTAHGNTPQSLEMLLERQWDQGSQFLMEQAQQFDSKNHHIDGFFFCLTTFFVFCFARTIQNNNDNKILFQNEFNSILVASLLSCLHDLRSENVRLEEHVNNLIARRDHLMAVNARLLAPMKETTQNQNQNSGK